MAVNELGNACEEKILDDEHVAVFVRVTRQTVKKIRANIWYHWCESVQGYHKLKDIPSKELNHLLSHIFICVRKHNMEEYKLCSLMPFHHSIHCHMCQTGQMTSILTNQEFEGYRKALEAKRKDL